VTTMPSTMGSERILVLTLTEREAEIAQDQFAQAGLAAHMCRDVNELCQEMERGAGAALLVEERLLNGSRTQLEAALSRQPPWSDFPLMVVAARRRRSESASEPLEKLGNVTLLDPPLRLRTMLRAARAALRSRRRQYAAREAIVERDRFLAMLGHELRNPLSAIALATEVASARTSGDSIHLPIMRRQIEHLTRLVDDLLDIARVTSGRIHLRTEPLRLDPLLRDTITLMRDRFQKNRIELDLDVEGACWVLGDAVRLEQVIVNLLTNAAKYTFPGGHVRVRCWKEGDDVQISVLDDGAGISADFLPLLFQQFKQGENTLDRAQGGLGVGLALVRALVELHGGSVSATSAGRGRGSEFRVRLPLLLGHQETVRLVAPPYEPAPSPMASSRRVLLVEDNEDARELLALTLRDAGHDVAEATDGEEGLRHLTELEVDVAIVDLGLPIIDGFEIARRARKLHGSALFLIALSGYGQPQDKRAALEAGFDLHLTKPTNMARLRSLVSGRPRPSSPAKA